MTHNNSEDSGHLQDSPDLKELRKILQKAKLKTPSDTRMRVIGDQVDNDPEDSGGPLFPEQN